MTLMFANRPLSSKYLHCSSIGGEPRECKWTLCTILICIDSECSQKHSCYTWHEKIDEITEKCKYWWYYWINNVDISWNERHFKSTDIKCNRFQWFQFYQNTRNVTNIRYRTMNNLILGYENLADLKIWADPNQLVPII